ncbi:MAG: VOC family protein [Spirochaetes bacterium]|nr:VOC family protein [Spirochaetota bacterium]
MSKLAHIGIVVNDLDHSLDFYQNILDCQVTDKYQDSHVSIVFVNYGDTIIELIKDKQGNSKKENGMIDHIAFEVENIEEKVNVLKKRNIKCLFKKPLEFNNWKIFFFEGPNKEKLEFLQKIS